MKVDLVAFDQRVLVSKIGAAVGGDNGRGDSASLTHFQPNVVYKAFTGNSSSSLIGLSCGVYYSVADQRRDHHGTRSRLQYPE